MIRQRFESSFSRCRCGVFSYYFPFMQDLKLKYYELMIMLAHHEGKYLTICKHYKAVFNTPIIQEDKNKMKEVMEYYCHD